MMTARAEVFDSIVVISLSRIVMAAAASDSIVT